MEIVSTGYVTTEGADTGITESSHWTGAVMRKGEKMDDLISRQAVIESIERMKPYHQDVDDVCEMIQNMPSVQPERNFLSVLTAEEQYDRIKWLFDYGKGFTDSRLAVIEWLEKHSAQPERKKGKWIYIDDDDTRYDSYWCSECRHKITVDPYRVDDIGFVLDDMKFCPNCGADMR